MNPYRYRVALRATHPHADLAPLFEVMGLRPSRHWTAGDARRAADGAALPGRHGDSYATAPLTDDGLAAGGARAWAEEPFEAFMRRQLDRLAPHQPALQALAGEGGRCELAVGLSAGESFGFELGTWLCEAAARLRLSLAFDIHPEPGAKAGRHELP
ncbi:hypothetical protein GCM10027359_15340 [Marilutibacter aestuarii]